MSAPVSITLIQLISEQTMQNLLPVLRLKSARLVHLTTPRTAMRSNHIIAAARQAQVQAEAENHPLSGMPTLAETFGAVKAAIQQCQGAGQTPVVNFTGGTKLMSIGAFSAALNSNHRALSLYVDTENEVFVDGHTSEGLSDLFDGDFSFTPLERALTVNTIAVANGRERVTGGRDWRPFLPLATHLFRNSIDEQATHEALYGRSGLLPRGQTPPDPGQWTELLDREFQLPQAVAKLAVAAGLVRASASGACLLPDCSRAELKALAHIRAQKRFIPDYEARRIAATDRVQRPITFLTGGWWEVIVADAVEGSGLFRDIRWSANAGQRGGADLEEDILAIDGVQVVCISCKRGGARSRLLPQLEELNARARSLGGNFTRRFLAVHQRLSGPVARNLRQRAHELGIRLLAPEDLANPDAFVRTRITA